MTMKLYYSRGACSLAVHIFLIETGRDFELVEASTRTGQVHTPEFREINSKARIPVLDDDGFVLTEVQAILDYLAGHPSARPFALANPHEKARAHELASYLASTAHIGFAQTWRPRRFLSSDAADADLYQRGRETVEEAFTLIESRLGQTEFAVSDTYSFVDPYLFVFYRWGPRLDFDMRASFPAWSAWADRMVQRDSVSAAMRAERIDIAGDVD